MSKNKQSAQETIDKLNREKEAYASALSLSNEAFMEKVKEFSILKRMGDAISWSMDKSQVCMEVVNIIIDETTTENCSLWLIKDGEIVLVAVRGQDNMEARFFPYDSPDSRRMKVGESAAGWVAEHGESLLIEDVAKSEHFILRPKDRIPPIKSLLCLPILGKDRPLGILNLSHPDIGAFSQENERVLSLITDQAGIVLTNLRLFEKIQTFNKQLEAMVEQRTTSLRQSEARYERSLVAGRVGIWEWQPGSWDVYTTANLKNLLGYEDLGYEWRLRNWLKLFHPEDRKVFLRKILKHIKGVGGPYEGENRMIHKDGRHLWFYVRAEGIRDKDGKTIRVFGSNTDITVRKKAELELKKAQEEALVHAHAEGRAEFATTVLHNIGNVLNSVNVNSANIRETVQKMGIQQLQLAMKMIEENTHDLDNFFNNHPKGRQLPQYIVQKTAIMNKDFEKLTHLAGDIGDKISLMHEIIETQQTHAKNPEGIGQEDLARLVNESLKVQMEFINREGITIHKRYKAIPPLVLPAAALIHVVINLIKNAVEAMNLMPRAHRSLYIDIFEDEQLNTHLKIRDTGIGVKPQNMEKMFVHGFTTKKHGHGFGLHYCAQSIREMGGEIAIESEGEGKGATFTITFPMEMRRHDYRPPSPLLEKTN